MRTLLAVAVAALLPALLAAQEPAEWYRDEAAGAIRDERYDRAVELLKEAQRAYPDSSEFFIRLGDLYYDEELYDLALAEYRNAEDVEPGAYRILSSIAYTLGLLNREAESAEYWSSLIELYADRIEPIQNLGWLLFKLHRLEEGVALLADAWEEFGPDADVAMTLGTLYAELYRFPESSRWYRRSIELAASRQSESFGAVAFYNLSLIQKLFHRYDEALESTEQSISILPRPTGYLARGELFELRMDFRAAHADYMRAYEMDDDTPLGRLNLALLYRRFGRLDEALAFATSVFDQGDNSWLYYYGTDITRHRMELHDLLADIHDGLANTARSRVAAGPLAWFGKAWDVVRHATLGWYHRARFRDLAGDVGRDVLAGGNLIDGNWYLYRANEPRPAVANTFLNRARELEVSAIPEANADYASETGILLGDWRSLLDLAGELDSVWRRMLLEQTLVGALTEGRTMPEPERTRTAVRLHAINPGALRQNRIELPVRLEVDAERPATGRVLRRMFGRAGFQITDETASVPRLEVNVGPGSIDAVVTAPGRRDSATAEIAGSSRRALADAVNRLAASLFVVE